jgi:hypothetical protein
METLLLVALAHLFCVRVCQPSLLNNRSLAVRTGQNKQRRSCQTVCQTGFVRFSLASTSRSALDRWQ